MLENKTSILESLHAEFMEVVGALKPNVSNFREGLGTALVGKVLRVVIYHKLYNVRKDTDLPFYRLSTITLPSATTELGETS